MGIQYLNGLQSVAWLLFRRPAPVRALADRCDAAALFALVQVTAKITDRVTRRLLDSGRPLSIPRDQVLRGNKTVPVVSSSGRPMYQEGVRPEFARGREPPWSLALDQLHAAMKEERVRWRYGAENLEGDPGLAGRITLHFSKDRGVVGETPPFTKLRRGERRKVCPDIRFAVEDLRRLWEAPRRSPPAETDTPKGRVEACKMYLIGRSGIPVPKKSVLLAAALSEITELRTREFDQAYKAVFQRRRGAPRKLAK